MSKSLSQCEQDVIQLLVEHDACTTADLQRHLAVTATAVRQRLSRLLAAGLIDRSAESEGRGRPIYKYWLTSAGKQQAGNNLADFAGALWQEIQRIEDPAVRRAIISGAAERMASSYEGQVAGETMEERLNSVARLFTDRDIPVAVEQQNGLPVLRVLSCPYPELANENHEVCEMEKQLFSQVVGDALELCQCRKDGDRCCTFQGSSGEPQN